MVIGLGAVAVVLAIAIVVVVSSDDDTGLRVDDVAQGVSARLVDGEAVFVARTGDDIRVFLPDTRHLPDDTLWWCPNEQVFVGVEHAELFGVDGLRLGGPTPSSLREYAVEVVEGRVVLNGLIVETLAQPMGEKPAALDQVDWSKPYDSGPGSFCDGAVSTPPK